MTNFKLKIASRRSKLAMVQTLWVKDQLEKKIPNLEVSIEAMATQGDKILDVALAKIGDKGLFTKGTLTVLDKSVHNATRWVELSYDKINLSIKSIVLFGFLNKNVRDEGFRLITIVYEFNDSDKDFLNEASKKLKAARLSFPLSPSKADDIDARNHFIQILGITKISLRKQFEMDNDKSYKRKRSTYLCQLHS